MILGIEGVLLGRVMRDTDMVMRRIRPEVTGCAAQRSFWGQVDPGGYASGTGSVYLCHITVSCPRCSWVVLFLAAGFCLIFLGDLRVWSYSLQCGKVCGHSCNAVAFPVARARCAALGPYRRVLGVCPFWVAEGWDSHAVGVWYLKCLS